jgi:hypothetical protein
VDGAHVGARPGRRQLLRWRHRLRGAKATERLLKNSRLLSYAGWGHTAYGRSLCTQEYVDAYLLDGTLPPVGTVCPANPNPFLDVPEESLAESTHMVGLPPAGTVQPEP